MKVGDLVRHKKLKKNGVITELLRSDKAKISLGSMQLTVELKDLEPRQEKPKKKKKVKSSAPYKKTGKIDLHGITQAEARERMEQFINDAILNHIDQIEVIHGIGSGKVKSAVYKLAKELSVVKSIREDQSNPGTSWIYL